MWHTISLHLTSTCIGWNSWNVYNRWVFGVGGRRPPLYWEAYPSHIPIGRPNHPLPPIGRPSFPAPPSRLRKGDSAVYALPGGLMVMMWMKHDKCSNSQSKRIKYQLAAFPRHYIPVCWYRHLSPCPQLSIWLLGRLGPTLLDNCRGVR